MYTDIIKRLEESKQECSMFIKERGETLNLISSLISDSVTESERKVLMASPGMALTAASIKSVDDINSGTFSSTFNELMDSKYDFMNVLVKAGLGVIQCRPIIMDVYRTFVAPNISSENVEFKVQVDAVNEYVPEHLEVYDYVIAKYDVKFREVK